MVDVTWWILNAVSAARSDGARNRSFKPARPILMLTWFYENMPLSIANLFRNRGQTGSGPTSCNVAAMQSIALLFVCALGSANAFSASAFAPSMRSLSLKNYASALQLTVFISFRTFKMIFEACSPAHIACCKITARLHFSNFFAWYWPIINWWLYRSISNIISSLVYFYFITVEIRLYVFTYKEKSNMLIVCSFGENFYSNRTYFLLALLFGSLNSTFCKFDEVRGVAGAFRTSNQHLVYGSSTPINRWKLEDEPWNSFWGHPARQRDRRSCQNFVRAGWASNITHSRALSFRKTRVRNLACFLYRMSSTKITSSVLGRLKRN